MIRQIADRGEALARAVPYSLVALTARVAAAGVFWRSGQAKLDGFGLADATFYLFREEYRLPVIPPDLAAYLATIGENLFSVLLFIGLASRLSAAALLAMTAVIQFLVYPDGWPVHILWAAALLLVLTQGPGVVSVDHLIRRIRGASEGASWAQ